VRRYVATRICFGKCVENTELQVSKRTAWSSVTIQNITASQFGQETVGILCTLPCSQEQATELTPLGPYKDQPPNLPWSDHLHNWWNINKIVIVIMQFSPFWCYFLSLRSKYSPQHPVLTHSFSKDFSEKEDVIAQVHSCSVYQFSWSSIEYRI